MRGDVIKSSQDRRRYAAIGVAAKKRTGHKIELRRPIHFVYFAFFRGASVLLLYGRPQGIPMRYQWLWLVLIVRADRIYHRDTPKQVLSAWKSSRAPVTKSPKN